MKDDGKPPQGDKPPASWPVWSYKHPNTGAIVNVQAPNLLVAINAVVAMAAGASYQMITQAKPPPDKPRIIPFTGGRIPPGGNA